MRMFPKNMLAFLASWIINKRYPKTRCHSGGARRAPVRWLAWPSGLARVECTRQVFLLPLVGNTPKLIEDSCPKAQIGWFHCSAFLLLAILCNLSFEIFARGQLASTCCAGHLAFHLLRGKRPGWQMDLSHLRWRRVLLILESGSGSKAKKPYGPKANIQKKLRIADNSIQ